MTYRGCTPLTDRRLRHVDFDFFIHLYDIQPIQTAATATTSDAIATPVSIPALSPPEDEPPPLVLLAFPSEEELGPLLLLALSPEDEPLPLLLLVLPPEEEPSPLLLLPFPPVLEDADVDSDVGAAAVAAGEEEPLTVLAMVEVASVAGVVCAEAEAWTYPACEQYARYIDAALVISLVSPLQ